MKRANTKNTPAHRGHLALPRTGPNSLLAIDSGNGRRLGHPPWHARGSKSIQR